MSWFRREVLDLVLLLLLLLLARRLARGHLVVVVCFACDNAKLCHNDRKSTIVVVVVNGLVIIKFN